MVRAARRLLALPGRRFAGALLVLLLIAGVVLMHAMSGSSGTHLPAHATVAVAHGTDHHGTDHHAAPAPDRDAPASATVATTHDTGAGACDGGCGHHEMVTAMCLMILAVLLTLALPGGRGLLLAEVPWRGLGLAVLSHARRAHGPSLHALGISRT
ncbi:hypothetical protein GCM10009809_17980 [Isoptericola hypogeus]|uniref:DUF2946 domain-containing protein n=1 Tax=Isoptericola hypogeus TaxID=300179 RepID=A0ABN2JE25_9MICO